MRRIIIYLSIKYKGEYNKIYQAIINKEKPGDDYLEIVNSFKGNVVTIIDKEYPEVLKKLYQPPFALFYKGNLDLLSKKVISIVGSRENPSFSSLSLKEIIKNIDEEYVICSGLARGIDTIALEEALNNNLKTIAFLPCGIDDCYPKNNLQLYKRIIENGLICSEYPYNKKVERNTFYMRNRLIAATCEKLVVAYAKRNSGTMITINYALEMGKDIYCIPSRNEDGSYCNQLIKEGAFIITTGEDLN